MANTFLQNNMANAIRFLTADAVEKANSGHPGLPMGAADIATALYSNFLRHTPEDPNWPNRDRFILSAGHGSMLLYSLLYLTGYKDMTLEELKNFRQLGARTAGHPEYGYAQGIETTTGPLGQGIANAVGMAIAERLSNSRYGDKIINHYTYVLVGDGCLMEGISQEAISVAGHLKLNKLIAFWDDNNISIDGPISLSDSTNQVERFKASGWNVISVDGHDQSQISQAIVDAKKSDNPTLIACKTTIGFGAPVKGGTNKIHGSPLGAAEIEATRQALDWPHAPFEIPADILTSWRETTAKYNEEKKAWDEAFSALSQAEQDEFNRRMQKKLPENFDEVIAAYKKEIMEKAPSVATRKASEQALAVINGILPETIGGSADLTGSNNTQTSCQSIVTADDFSGRYIHYGIREHAMGAIMNGIALYGGFIPYGGTFLCFSDYVRPAMRLSSLMGLRVIYVMTHDSIGLGEDGPTHQPVEHLASLRAIPNHLVFRPADAVETLECWQLALSQANTPSTLALTRQNLPTIRSGEAEVNLSSFGAYEISSSKLNDNALTTIFATGSEVEIALKAQTMLEEDNIPTRVVSVPCFELFKKQSVVYRKQIIGDSPVKVAVEAAIRQGWDSFIGPDDIFIGMHNFGASAPIDELYEHFGITAEQIVLSVKNKLTN